VLPVGSRDYKIIWENQWEFQVDKNYTLIVLATVKLTFCLEITIPGKKQGKCANDGGKNNPSKYPAKKIACP
jgi:hypothetical protein